MHDFHIDLIWTKLQIAFTALGGWLGYFLGGMDGLLIALVVFATLDYVTGVMCAISDHKLSSAVGFRGICRKVLIFMLVGGGAYSGRPRCRHRLRPAQRRDLLLSLQRGCFPAGERFLSGSARPRKAEGGA